MKTKVKMYCLIDKTDGKIIKLCDNTERWIVGFEYKKDLISFCNDECAGIDSSTEEIKKIEFEVEL